MNKLKLWSALLMALTSSTNALAQTGSPLTGTWQTSYDLDGKMMYVIYEIKNEQGKLKCYSLYVKDNEGNKEAHNTIVMTEIAFKDGKGTANYTLEYEDEVYEVEATLELVNSNTLRIQYSYYGYADTETWKRVNK